MFECLPPQTIEKRGTHESANITEENVADLRVLGGLFKGEIRQLLFDREGALLVLTGRGVTRLDPDTHAETGSWLEAEAIDALYLCGEKLWVLTSSAIYLGSFGEELGQPFAEYTNRYGNIHVAHGTQLALVQPRGVMLLDATSEDTRSFTFTEEWYQALWRQVAPDTALLSPGGETVGVSCGTDYTVLWDVETGDCLYQRERTGMSQLLDGERSLGKYISNVYNFKTDAYESFSPKGDKAFVIDGMVVTGTSEGACAVYDPKDLSLHFSLDELPSEAGSGSASVCVARSETHVATCQFRSGTLRVASAKGLQESHHWIGGAKGFSASDEGDRALIWRGWGEGCAEVLDLEEGTMYEIKSGLTGGLICPGITQNGESLVLPCGNNLKARTVYTSPPGAQEGEEVHKIRSFASAFQAFEQDKYAILTYTLGSQGEIAIHQAGIKRAIAKVKHNKEKPWRFHIGYDANELVVAWKKEIILYDMTKRPKAKEVIERRTNALALGPPSHLAYTWHNEAGKELVIRTSRAEVSVALEETIPYSSQSTRLAFSEDGALLFVGRVDGILEARDTETGEVLTSLPLAYRGFVSIQLIGHALWCLGEDGSLTMVGIHQKRK